MLIRERSLIKKPGADWKRICVKKNEKTLLWNKTCGVIIGPFLGGNFGKGATPDIETWSGCSGHNLANK